MNEEPAIAEPSRYRAFISYSHADAKFAHWLHRKLESWRLPDKTRLTPVFIDRAELSAGSDLSAQVQAALEQSAALIVVCSPKARASRWVGLEIELFRKLHPGRPVLAALIEGEPDEAFPDPLVRSGDKAIEPLAADFRKGHDGQRLGLIKLVAGLSGLPLDRLVQRDAAARQRRVMAVTAGALALVLILSAALIIALRARAEAERQRAEAEGLVEFMLTDLRDKLKGVGSLEVMSTVNARAMEHYAKEDIANLPDDIVLRQASLIQKMAEDEFSSTGSIQRGKDLAKQALRLTSRLLARDPKNPNFVFQHAQSEYWVGYGAFLSPGRGTERDVRNAETHWSEYRRLALRLFDLEKGSERSSRELTYANSNLCTLKLEQPKLATADIGVCQDARLATERLVGQSPAEPGKAIELANRLGWEAQALSLSGDKRTGLKLRERQLGLIRGQLTGQAASDYRLIEAHLLALIGIAKNYADVGDFTQAEAHFGQAQKIANELVRRDPKNRDWIMWKRMVDKEKEGYKNARR